MRFASQFVSCCLLALPATAWAEGNTKLSTAEQAFAKAMSNASLVGAFTDSDTPGKPPHTERYDIGQVRKVGDGLWLIPTRIRYGQHDVTLPITLPVRFAGDTAVIEVNKVGFPGLGTFSARVLVHDGRYAGYWQGGSHGGHLFGKLQRTKSPAKPSLPPKDAKPSES